MAKLNDPFLRPTADGLVDPFAPTPPSSQEPAGVSATDYLKQLGGGAVSAVGYGVRGLAEGIMLPARGNDPLLDVSAAAQLGSRIGDFGQELAGSVSEAAQQRIATSTPTGRITDPSSWSLGTDPSVSGYALQAANVLGQVAPMAGAAIATKGRMAPSAAVGASVGGGAAADSEEQRILDLPADQLAALPGYQKRLAAGMSPEQARASLAVDTARGAFKTAAPLGAADALTQVLPFTGAAQRALAQAVGPSRLARVGAGAVGGAIGEGTQEVAEQAFATVGADTVTGENRDPLADSFQQFALGAIGGAPIAAAAGLLPADPALRRPAAEQLADPAADPAAAPEVATTVEQTVLRPEDGPLSHAVTKDAAAQAGLPAPVPVAVTSTLADSGTLEQASKASSKESTKESPKDRPAPLEATGLAAAQGTDVGTDLEAEEAANQVPPKDPERDLASLIEAGRTPGAMPKVSAIVKWGYSPNEARDLRQRALAQLSNDARAQRRDDLFQDPAAAAAPLESANVRQEDDPPGAERGAGPGEPVAGSAQPSGVPGQAGAPVRQEEGGQGRREEGGQEVRQEEAPVPEPAGRGGSRVSIDPTPELLDGDITPPSGSPFTIRGAAESNARRHPGSEVVELAEGGFVVRLPTPEPDHAPQPVATDAGGTAGAADVSAPAASTPAGAADDATVAAGAPAEPGAAPVAATPDPAAAAAGPAAPAPRPPATPESPAPAGEARPAVPPAPAAPAAATSSAATSEPAVRPGVEAPASGEPATGGRGESVKTESATQSGEGRRAPLVVVNTIGPDGLTDAERTAGKAPLVTLVEARNQLIELRSQAEAQGRVADARLLERVRRQERLVRQLEQQGAAAPADGDGQQDELDAEMRSYEARQTAAPKKLGNTWEANGRADHADGKPRELPGYFTKPNSPNAKAWLRGWDAAEADKKAPTADGPEAVDRYEPAPKAIGKRNDFARRHIVPKGYEKETPWVQNTRTRAYEVETTRRDDRVEVGSKTSVNYYQSADSGNEFSASPRIVIRQRDDGYHLSAHKYAFGGETALPYGPFPTEAAAIDAAEAAVRGSGLLAPFGRPTVFAFPATIETAVPVEREAEKPATKGLRQDTKFRAMAKALDINLESEAGRAAAMGWTDAAIGRPANTDHRTDPNTGEFRSPGFNPIDYYISAYAAQRTGEARAIRVLEATKVYNEYDVDAASDQAYDDAVEYLRWAGYHRDTKTEQVQPGVRDGRSFQTRVGSDPKIKAGHLSVDGRHAFPLKALLSEIDPPAQPTAGDKAAAPAENGQPTKSGVQAAKDKVMALRAKIVKLQDGLADSALSPEVREQLFRARSQLQNAETQLRAERANAFSDEPADTGTASDAKPDKALLIPRRAPNGGVAIEVQPINPDKPAATDAAPVDTAVTPPAATVTPEATPNEPASPRSESPQALDEAPADESPAAADAADAGTSPARRRGERAGADRGADGERVPGARSRGGRAGRVDPAAAGSGGEPGVGTRRAGREGSRVPEDDGGLDLFAQPAASPSALPATNFAITDDVRLGEGGEVEKFRDNLAAIRVLKTLEREQRRATPDEQRTLARYVGWGGLANAFAAPDGSYKDGWASRALELSSLLTPAELKAARRSTRNAHYTSAPVVRSMWAALERLGYRGGMALEPSMGTGNFLGLAPAGLAGETRFVGVEFDSLTARIAGALYPQAAVLHSGFQNVPLADGAFDLVIGNPPFGTESLKFQYKPEFNGHSIHNQFFLGSLDALREDGVMAMVVSRYLLDAKGADARLQMAARADLIGAIRLPDIAFKENARTEVVTDVLLFRKLNAAEQAAREALLTEARTAKGERDRAAARAALPVWVDTAEIPDPAGGDPLTVNRYFIDHPQMVLGTMDGTGKMQAGPTLRVHVPKGTALEPLLEGAIARLPANVLPQADRAAAAKARFDDMVAALRIALEGREAGAVSVDAGGALQQVVERETPEGEYELALRPVTAETPWSRQLMLDAQGRYFRLVEKVDANGNKVKDGRSNVYEREVFATAADVPASLRLGASKFERLTALVKLRDLLVAQLTLEAENAPEAALTENRTGLRTAYEAFVKKHEHISAPKNASLVSDMPDGALVLALELGYRPEITKAQAAKTGKPARPASATPAPILKERVVLPYAPPTSAASPADALVITLSESGRIDLERIAALLGTDADGAAGAIGSGDKPLAFLDPETQHWEPANGYLSGNVRRKLEAAKAAGLSGNVAALEAVQPERWTAENVTVHLGAGWVPGRVYADFLEHLVGGRASVNYSQLTNSFGVSNPTADRARAVQWGTDDVGAVDLLDAMLNSRAIKVTRRTSDGNTYVDQEATALAQLKARQIGVEFADWVFADGDRRNQLVDQFNDKFNTRVTRQHDGSHLQLPGKVPDAIIKLRRHQKNAIWRGIAERFTLYDHAVGAGKTFTGIARAMERRRMGLSRKPMIVVPNHMVEQFTADAYRLYPAARVLAAGQADFERKRRRKLFAKIATGDWDLVIVPHSSFGFIGIAPETEQRYLEQEIALAQAAIVEAEEEAAEAGLGGRFKPFNVKEAERLLEKLEARLSGLGKKTRDRLLTFEQLGVDDLTVDEAHEFKNLFYSSRLTGVRGMGDKAGSQKAFDLYNKTRVLRDSPTGSVTFMTGTPISNSAVEMFTLMRYLAADELQELGLEHFDAWRAQFVEADTKFEPTESGRLKEVNRLGRTWSNMRSLMELYYSFTDAVSNDDIKRWYAEDNGGAQFPLPKVKGGERQQVVIKPTAAQDVMLKEVMRSFDDLDTIRDPKERNAARLRLMDRARKLSLDIRAVDPRNPSQEEGGKLERVADEVKRIYDATTADKGTQLVFLDRSVPKAKGDDKVIKAWEKLEQARDAAARSGDEGAYRQAVEAMEEFTVGGVAYDAPSVQVLREAQGGGWNAYQQIKDHLVARGIPAEQVRFVQEANNDAQKQALFDAVNAGEVRVLIGSTPRMGAGTNVQQRLVGLHHVDVTWKPSDIEQREGRIIRQGNQLLEQYGIDNFEVEILAYATERTVDAKMWDLNATKLKTINGIRKYDGVFSMDFADDDAVGMAEMAALASGDPKLLERVTLMAQIDQLELLERAHRRKVFGVKDRIHAAQRDIDRLPARIERAQRLAEHFERAEADLLATANARSVTVEGQTFNDRTAALKAAYDAMDAQKAGKDRAPFSVAIGKGRATTKEAINDLVGAALGDADPFAITIGKDALGERGAAAKAVAAIANDMKPGADGRTVGRYLGLDLVLDRAADALALSLVEASGATVASIDGTAGKAGTDGFSTQYVRGLLGSLERTVSRGGFAFDALNAQRALDRARAELPALEAQDNQPFAQAAELADKRQRLEALTAELAGAPASEPAEPVGAQARPAADRAPAAGIKPDVLDRAVQAQVKGWDGDIPSVRVVATARDLPAQARTQDGWERAEGWYDGHNAIYLVAANLPNLTRAQQVLAHEAFGHYGVEGVLGKADWTRIVGDVARLRGSGRASLSADLRGVLASVEQRYGDESPAQFAREFLAVMAERGVKAPVLARVLAALRRWLRALGFKLDAWADAELRTILADGIRHVRRSGTRTRTGNRTAAAPAADAPGLAANEDPFEENGSGDSSASLEAIRRLAEERELGRARMVIEANGTVRPLIGVDAVDTTARPGQIIVQRNIGRDEWTVLSHGADLSAGIVQGRVAAARERLASNAAFSLAATAPGDFLSTIGMASREPDEGVLARLRDKLEDWRPALLGTLTLRQLAEVTAAYLPAGGTYVDLMTKMATRRNLLQEDVGKLAAKWEGMQRADRRSATAAQKAARDTDSDRTIDVMHAATIAGVDPAQAFKPGQVVLFSNGDTVLLDDTNGRAAIAALEAKRAAADGPITKTLARDIAMIEAGMERETARVAAYPRLVRQFNALPTEWQTLYREVRDAYEARADATLDALIARIEALEMDAREKKALVERMRANFESARVEAPYFPLSRFGEFWAAFEKPGKDGQTERQFVMAETKRARDQAIKQAEAAGYTVTKKGRKIDNVRAQDGASGGFVHEINELLTEAHVDEKVRDEVYQLYLRTLPDVSIRKQFIHRKKVAGYDNDALRAFAGQMFHGAHQLARLEYGLQLGDALAEIVRQAKAAQDLADGDADRASAAANEFKRRHEWVQNPTSARWAQLASSANFVFYLGLSPASALVNLTQTAIVSYPALASRYGAMKALQATTEAMAQAIKTRGTAGRLADTLTDAQEKAAFEQLLHMGAIDVTQAHDLAGLGDGDSRDYNPLQYKVMNTVSSLFHRAEVINREATGLAAYRLARAAGESHEAAVKRAADTIWQTHYDYSNANRARFMQSDAAKVLFAFKQYAQSTTYYLWRAFYEATKGESPEVKRMARNRLLGTLGMTAAFSGVMGMPLLSLTFAIANAMAAAFGDDDEPWDAETEFRNFLADLLGPRLGAVAQDGAIEGVLGALGLPAPEISSRVSLDQLWFRKPDQEVEGRDLYVHLLEQIAGPIAGALGNVVITGPSMVAEGMETGNDDLAWRGVEKMLPKAARDAMKAVRYATSGVNTVRGDALVEDVSVAQWAFQGLGFMPAEVARQYEVNASTKRYESYILDRRSALLDAYALAVRNHDTEAVRSVLAKIRAFNQAHREIGINANTIRRSLQSRQKFSERAVNGIAVNPKLERALQERIRFAEAAEAE